MSKYLGTTEDKIIITAIEKGSINVKFYYENSTPEYVRPKQSPFHGRLLKEEQVFNQLNLCPEHFCQQGDMNFSELNC